MCVAHAKDRSAAVESLDHAFMHLHRLKMMKPTDGIYVPELGRSVDVAKVFACLSVAELTAARTESGEPVTVKDVAQMSHLEHSTVSRLLGDGEQEGLVVRGPHPGDGRRTTVTLTADGQCALDAFAASRVAFISNFLAAWDVDDIAKLAELLERLAQDALSPALEAGLAAGVAAATQP